MFKRFLEWIGLKVENSEGKCYASCMVLANIQSEKTAKKLFLLGKYHAKQEQAKPLVSLKGILKGIKISANDFKRARLSLFKR